MKKSKAIQLILITAGLAACNTQSAGDWEDGSSKTYVRGDSTAAYARTYHGGPAAMLWYCAFRPYGSFINGQYRHGGYYSRNIPHQSNIGSNASKSYVPRGGFGRTGVRAVGG